MLDPKITRTLDADAQGHWLGFIAKYCSDLYSQVSAGMEENEVLNFMMGVQFASTIEGRLTAGVATEDDIEWLEAAEAEMDERGPEKDPLKTVEFTFAVPSVYHTRILQDGVISLTYSVLKLAGFNIMRTDVMIDRVDPDTVSDANLTINFDVEGESWDLLDWLSATMQRLFEVLQVPHKDPKSITVAVNGHPVSWSNNQIQVVPEELGKGRVAVWGRKITFHPELPLTGGQLDDLLEDIHMVIEKSAGHPNYVDVIVDPTEGLTGTYHLTLEFHTTVWEKHPLQAKKIVKATDMLIRSKYGVETTLEVVERTKYVG